mgnify:CR=1 FL=1
MNIMETEPSVAELARIAARNAKVETTLLAVNLIAKHLTEIDRVATNHRNFDPYSLQSYHVDRMVAVETKLAEIVTLLGSIPAR